MKWVGVVGLLGFLLTDMDEVAGSLALAGDVRLEISVDTVLHFSVEGLVQQTFEALQAVRVVGQAEFTKTDKWSTQTHYYSYRQYSHYRHQSLYLLLRLICLGVESIDLDCMRVQITTEEYNNRHWETNVMKRLPHRGSHNTIIIKSSHICLYDPHDMHVYNGLKSFIWCVKYDPKRNTVKNTVSLSNIVWHNMWQWQDSCYSVMNLAPDLRRSIECWVSSVSVHHLCYMLLCNSKTAHQSISSVFVKTWGHMQHPLDLMCFSCEDLTSSKTWMCAANMRGYVNLCALTVLHMLFPIQTTAAIRSWDTKLETENIYYSIWINTVFWDWLATEN